MADVSDLVAEKDAALEDLEEAQERVNNVDIALQEAKDQAEDAQEQTESSY